MSCPGFHHLLCINKTVIKIAASILYKSIIVKSLGEESKLISSLCESNYHYRQYVKEVTFNNCALPKVDDMSKTDLDNLDSNSEFERFLAITPHVEEFYWTRHHKNLLDNLAISRNLWKLKRIPNSRYLLLGLQRIQ